VSSATSALLLNSPSHQRPTPKPQAPLPPFDPDDPQGGLVHRVPPPELFIPPGPDRLFMRADFCGVTLRKDRWGPIPFLKGANSTPLEMLMTPMLVLYPRAIQDGCLTEHAERNLTHMVISADGWNLTDNGFNPTKTAMVLWARYLQSWGFYVVYWRSQPMLDDPILEALVDSYAIDWCIPGEEVDAKVTKEQYDAIIQNTLSITANGIPIGAHFTANWPEGFPRDTMVPNWSQYDGKLHCLWQADQNESAGMQAARMYYARERLAFGSIGGDGTPAPHSRVYAFETMATKQLYGQCDEAYGNLRTLELMFATRNDSNIPAMAGFGNGCRWPSGVPI
jgi:hypothetical protein